MKLMMSPIPLFVMLMLTLPQIAFANTPSDLTTVAYVDPVRYTGQWFEIAKIPNSFQRKCLASKAEYTLKKGKLGVLNTCTLKNGKVKKASAIALIKDKETNAKLKVSFVPLVNHLGWFGGDYWIIELDEKDYSYVLVGHPKRTFFWLLARTPIIEEGLYNSLLDRAVELGYKKSDIIKSPTWNKE